MPNRLRPCAFVVALLLLVPAASAAAQQVRGTVMDGPGGTPLSGALVALFDADSVVRATTLSDEAGAFSLRAPIGLTLQLWVQRLGYRTLASVPIVLSAADSLSLEVRMRPLPVALEGVTARGRSTLRPELERFLQRRENGFGRTFGPEELAMLPPTSAAVVLSSLAGSSLVPGAAGTVLARSRLSHREVAGIRGVCQPTVYLDGLLVEKTPPGLGDASRSMGVPISSYVSAEEILGVEVYRRPAHAPHEFQRPLMEDCPVVLIWTKLSFGIGDEPG